MKQGYSLIQQINNKLNKTSEIEQQIFSKQIKTPSIIDSSEKSLEKKNNDEPVTIKQINDLISKFNKSTATILKGGEGYPFIDWKNIEGAVLSNSKSLSNSSDDKVLRFEFQVNIDDEYEFLRPIYADDFDIANGHIDFYFGLYSMSGELLLFKSYLSLKSSYALTNIYISPGEYLIRIAIDYDWFSSSYTPEFNLNLEQGKFQRQLVPMISIERGE